MGPYGHPFGPCPVFAWIRGQELIQQGVSTIRYASWDLLPVLDEPTARIPAYREGVNAPEPSAFKVKRDCAMLALLISCGLRRTELGALEADRIQQPEGRRVIPDLVGKGNRLRTVGVPTVVKVGPTLG